MTIESFRGAMATALREGCGLNASPRLSSRVLPPYAMFDFEVRYDLTFDRGADEYRGTLTVWAQRDNEDESQRFLDVLRDPNESRSIKTVLEADDGVNDTVDYLRIVSASKVQVVAAGNPAVEFLTVDFEFEVAISA